ncbi:MAG: HAD-IC family P-type ATPase [Xanthobacteraceae bacterium]|nr:HAD-IC family P-type ATPase [Xanthobacteraceae bacterium]
MPGDVTGLSTSEAARRLADIGPNVAAELHSRGIARLAEHFWAPVPWMLEATIILQFVVGERAEAMMIAALLILNVAVGLFQENRADAALALLKQKLSLNSRAKRDGVWRTVAAATLVPGDIVQLSLGAVVPADALILDGSVLLDQSMLTGESLPVEAGADAQAYAGALVRRGEAVARVTATGTRTYFGRAAELVRIAHVTSSEEKAVLGLVRNLTIVNAAITVGLVAYAHVLALPSTQIIQLVLTALLSAVPVALPATFTLGAALGAKAIALKGVLLTRLSALHEAATIDVLCADKTGTLTNNRLEVVDVQPLAAGWTRADVLAFAALASSAEGQDPVDSAIRKAAQTVSATRAVPAPVRFIPFDPARKKSEVIAREAKGETIRVCKGAPAAVAPLDTEAAAVLDSLSRAGHRTLAVAVGQPDEMALIGLVALSDPPRADSAALLQELRRLGVEPVMVTGDAAATAATVAHEIGLQGRVCPPGQIPNRVNPEDFAVYAGVFPDQKFRLVKALQSGGHAVGMCGDGANDAPALRQAQMGIAVSTATDVAKAAAGIVLTDPGLGGIVMAIREGRIVFRRVLTYTLGILVNKCVTLVVLGAGLVLTGHPVLTPMLQALSMLTNDFVSMARTADRATPSPRPNRWRVRNLTLAAIPLALSKFAFCIAVLAVARFRYHLGIGQIQTLTFIMLVFAGQSVVYVLRERGHFWSSRPSRTMLLASLADISVVISFALSGVLMQKLPPQIIFMLLAATIAFAFVLDQVKVLVLARWPIE